MELRTKEMAWEQRLLTRAAQNRKPVSGSLELTPICNMRCDMCYARLNPEEVESKGGLRSAGEWILLAEQMRRAGVLFLLLTGGEPLLFPEFRLLYVELRKMGFILTVNTNATMIDEGWAEFFSQYKPRRVNVTLYGADEAAYEKLCHYPGGFEKTLRGIRLLRSRGVDVRIGVSLTKHNRADLERITAIAVEMNTALNIDPCMMPDMNAREKPFSEQVRLLPQEAAHAKIESLRLLEKEQLRMYAAAMLLAVENAKPERKEPQKMSCLAGRCSFAVGWQGRMHPCVMLPQPDASVFEMSFETAWKTVSKGVDEIELSTHCSKCKMRIVCQTCAARALHETGRLDGAPEYMCRYTQEIMRLLEKQINS